MKKSSDKREHEKKEKHYSESETIPMESTLRQPAYPKGIKPPPTRGYTYKRILQLSIQAVINAIIIGFIAKIMIALIDFVTNVCFYGKFSFHAAAPGIESLGIFVIFIPILGGIIVGIMAR